MAIYTNFCCRSGGSNLNAGTRTGSTTEPGTAASFTYASGSLVASTRIFTVASGNPSTDGVAVGDFVSIYADGSTATGYVALVTAVTSTTITTDATAKAGTIPTDGTNNRTLRVGGAWLGPDGATPWLDTFPGQALMNVAGNPARVNLKNDRTYAITAAISLATGDVKYVAGYGSAYGDGGRAAVDGGTSGASYVLFTVGGTASAVALQDLEFRNNGATGSSAAVSVAGTLALVRVAVHDVRGNGVTSTGNVVASECEFYACNQSNTANSGGLSASGGGAFSRCVFHDNAGTNSLGLAGTGAKDYSVRGCVFDTNGSTARGGFYCTGSAVVEGCEFYNNALHGIYNAGYTLVVDNCNFAKNGGNGVYNSQALTVVRNCGFGSGTMANTSGATGTAGASSVNDESGSVTYAADVTPWADPATGDFRITLAAAKGAGRGAYLQTASGYAGTVAYPDIGAGQSAGASQSFPIFRSSVIGGAS